MVRAEVLHTHKVHGPSDSHAHHCEVLRRCGCPGSRQHHGWVLPESTVEEGLIGKRLLLFLGRQRSPASFQTGEAS